MFRRSYTDKRLIELITGNSSSQREEAIIYIYKTNQKKTIGRLRKSYGKTINNPELKSIFIQAVGKVIQNIEVSRFKGESTIATYLTGIAINFCKQFIEKEIKNRGGTPGGKEKEEVDLDEFMYIHLKEHTRKPKIESVSTHEYDLDVFAGIKKALNKLSIDCQKLLRLWSKGYSYQEVLETTQKYKSTDVVKTQKSRCLKSLKNAIQKDAYLKQLFQEIENNRKNV